MSSSLTWSTAERQTLNLMELLEKGMNIALKDAQGAGFSSVQVGCGWDMKDGHAVDVDLSLGLLNARYADGGKFIANDALVYFGRKEYQGVHHHGDNLTGAGDGDDEKIDITLASLPTSCMACAVVVNIYSNAGNFGQVKNVVTNIYSDTAGTEKIATCDLTEDYSGKNAIIVGEFYKKDGNWKYQAIGEGITGDLKTLITRWE